MNLLLRVIKSRTFVYGLVLIAVMALLVIFFDEKSETPQKPKVDFTSNAIESAETIVLGVLAPMTGEYAALGQSIAKGAKAAEYVINKNGGLLGRNVQVIVSDTRSTRGLTAELAKDLIQRAKSPVLVGAFGEEATVEAIEVAEQMKTPYIYVSNGPVKTCRNDDVLKTSKYVWGTGLTQSMMVEPFMIHLAQKVREPETTFRIYYFSSDDPQQRDLVQNAISTSESLGFATLSDVVVDLRIRDFFKRIRQIFGEKPDLLFVGTSRSTSPYFAKQAHKLGVRAEMAWAGLGNFEYEELIADTTSYDRFMTTARYLHSIDNEENKEFLKVWSELYTNPDDKPTALAVAGSYTAIMLARAAFQKAKSLDSEAFAEAMNNLELKLPQGRVVVGADNNLLLQPLYAVEVKDGAVQLSEYLGDVSHPALEDCAIEPVEVNLPDVQ